MDTGAWQAKVHGVARVGHGLVTKLPQPIVSSVPQTTQPATGRKPQSDTIPKGACS